MNRFEDKLKSLGLREPPAELRRQILDSASAEKTAKSEARGKLRETLIGMASSKWFLFLVLPMMLVGSAGVFAFSYEERGSHRRWEAVQKKLEDAGETLDYTGAFAEPVPDELNFMATPALYGLEESMSGLPENDPLVLRNLRLEKLPRLVPPEEYDADSGPIDLGKWHVSDDDKKTPLSELGDRPEETLLALLHEDKALFDELAQAAKRPHSQPVHSIDERLQGKKLWDLAIGHLGALQQLSKLTSLRAIAAARLGDRQTARESLAILFKCKEAADVDGTLINALVSFTIRAILEARLPDLLRESCWTDEDLVWLQERVSHGDGFDEALRAFRCEMAFAAQSYDEMLTMPRGERIRLIQMTSDSNEPTIASALGHLIPDGMFRRNKARAVEWLYEFSVKPLKERDIEAIQSASTRLKNEVASLNWFSIPGSFIAKATVPATGGISHVGLRSEMHRRMMEAAVALERYRRNEGGFPSELAALVPKYLATVPVDVAAKEKDTPIRYKLEKEGYRMEATPVDSRGSTKKSVGLVFVR